MSSWGGAARGARPGVAIACALFSALGAAACAPRRPPAKAPFFAIWLGAESTAPGGAELARLESAGAREVFVEIAVVEGSTGSTRLVARHAPPLARGTAATLVVRGSWRPDGASAAGVARSWVESLALLEAEAERRGARPVGLHLALDAAGEEASLAHAVRALRRELGPRLHLSGELDPGRLDEGDAAELARALDFVVVEAYGRPAAQPDDGAAWDPERTARIVAALDRLDVPYALAAWTLGGAERRAADGSVAERATAFDVGALVRAGGLEPKPGSVFEGLGRQVIERVAREPTRIGGWTLARGESIRIARPTTADLERFLEAAAPVAGSRRLGAVLRRWPGPGETLSLPAASLAAALEPGAAEPALAVRLAAEPAASGRAVFRVVLENESAEATDFGALGANYLELRLERGVLGAVDPGGFARAERSRDGTTRSVRAMREADTLRLFAVYLGPGERITSGPIEVRGGSATDPVAVSGSFILPGGRELTLPARNLTARTEQVR